MFIIIIFMRLLIGVNKSRDRYYRKTRAAKQEKEENIGGPRTSVCCHWRMLPLAYAATRATDLTRVFGPLKNVTKNPVKKNSFAKN